MDDLIETTLRNRTDAIARKINATLYGDYGPHPTRWQRIKILPSHYRRRITDAWLVLTGKADIE
jgi:hypothetical protein